MRMRGSSLRLARELLACGTLLAALRLSGEDMDLPRARLALAAAPIPAEAKAAIQARVDASPNVFLRYVSAASSEAAADLMLLARVDKEKALPKAYAPADLVALDGTGLSVSRAGHHLRKPAYIALKAMDAAARLDGTNLVVASSYRSYDYQVEVWNRTVKSDGLAATEASVAPPGHSQHQLGTAVDFGPISEAFAQTKASQLAGDERAALRLFAVLPEGPDGDHRLRVGELALSLHRQGGGSARRGVLRRNPGVRPVVPREALIAIQGEALISSARNRGRRAPTRAGSLRTSSRRRF